MATLKMHDIELYRTDEQLPLTMDSSFATMRQPDGSIWFFHQDWSFRQIFRGTAEDPLMERIGDHTIDYNGAAINGDHGLGGSNVWIMGVVEHKDVLIAVCHREHLLNLCEEDLPNARRRAFNFHIGLAISYNNGLHWKYIGDVCSNVRNNQGVEPNMGGCPTLKVGPWLQFFFNDYKRDGSRHITAARCDLDECVECLKQGKLPLVLKYTREDEFNSDGLLGIGTMIIPGSNKDGCDAHADAAYCAPLGKYLITVQTHGLGKLLMFQSDDAIHWDPEPIVVHDAGRGNHMQPYSTFVAITEDDSSADMTTIGREFYIYWPVKHLDHGYDCDTLYRRKFTLEG